MKKFLGIFNKIFGVIRNTFSPENMKNADAVANQIKDMIRYALPAVEVIAALTPTRGDDVIIALIKRFMMETPIPESGKFDTATVQGVMMNAAQIIVRDNLSAAILAAGEGGIKIGSQFIKDHSEIPDSVINAATNSVYAVLKNSMTEKVN